MKRRHDLGGQRLSRLGLIGLVTALLLAACTGQEATDTTDTTDAATTTTAATEATDTTSGADTTVPAPTCSVRFLSAESFWADWDPYQTNALSQFRLNRQNYDMLLDFPTGDLSQPAPMLATEWPRSTTGPGSSRCAKA